MFRLIGNENMKIYVRLRTWILLAILAVAALLVAVVMHSHQHADPNWKQALMLSNAAAQHTLNQNGSHMPASTIQRLKEEIQLNQYYISHNVDPNLTTGWKFAVTAQNLAALLIAFIVVVAGDIVANEFSTGTIKMLLTQTATRTKILLSKYIAAILFGLFMTAAMLVLTLVIGWIFFGVGGASEPHIYLNAHSQIEQMDTAAYLFMQYGFLLVQMVITVTIAFMISAIFRSSALAITVSLLAYLIGNMLVTALSSFSWVKYILFANTDLSQFFIGGPAIPGLTLGFSITMLITYFVVMNALAWIIFVKRDVAYT